METCTIRPVTAEIDVRLDELYRAREVTLATPASVERVRRLAELAEAEAVLWAELAEHCRCRVHWRAALAGREYALYLARRWRERASSRLAGGKGASGSVLGGGLR